MACREFFDAHKGNSDKCKLMQDMSEDELVSWELKQSSEFSPGVVDNSEYLYHQIVDPTHLDPLTETLHPTAFQAASSIGLSVNRFKYSTFEELVKRGTARAAEFNQNNPDKPMRSLWGFVSFHAERVRDLVSRSMIDQTQRRGYFIYDTANPDDISHADICQGVKSTKDFRSTRSKLYDLAKEGMIKL